MEPDDIDSNVAIVLSDVVVSNCGVFVKQNEVLAPLLNNKWFDASKK